MSKILKTNLLSNLKDLKTIYTPAVVDRVSEIQFQVIENISGQISRINALRID